MDIPPEVWTNFPSLLIFIFFLIYYLKRQDTRDDKRDEIHRSEIENMSKILSETLREQREADRRVMEKLGNALERISTRITEVMHKITDGKE